MRYAIILPLINAVTIAQFLVFRIGARRGVALEKQVEGLHKASGLDLR